MPDDMLSLALEPEAASVFCKKELGQAVIVGTKFAVLDLGGTNHLFSKSNACVVLLDLITEVVIFQKKCSLCRSIFIL